MSRVVQSVKALEDLDDIWRYIASDNINAAQRWLDRIDEKFRRLADFPGIGRMCEELGPSIRSYPFGRSLIFIRLSKTASA